MDKNFDKNDGNFRMARAVFYFFLFFSVTAVVAGSIVLMVGGAYASGIVCLVGGLLAIFGAWALMELLFSFLLDIKYIRDELHESNRTKIVTVKKQKDDVLNKDKQ